MAPNAISLVDSIRRELLLLRDLATDLIASRKAFTGNEIERIYEHISRQADLSEKLAKAQQDRARVWNASPIAPPGIVPAESNLRASLETLDASTSADLRALLMELALAEGEVRNLNRVHSLLLDGSRRTLNVLSNALAAFAPTYSQPPVRNAVPVDLPDAPAQTLRGSRP